MAIKLGSIFYKITLGNFYFYLLLSINQGWLFTHTDKQGIGCQTSSLILGLSRLYFNIFKIKGFGFKFVTTSKGLLIKVGVTHRILINICRNQKLKYISKKVIIFLGRHYSEIKMCFLFLIFYFKSFVYKKEGLVYKGSIFNAKLPKKKIKF